MTVREWYKEAIVGKHHSLQLFIEFLVYEKKAVTFDDDGDKLSYFLQDKFNKKMNEYLLGYERVRKGE